MPKSFERVSEVQTQDIEQYITPTDETARIERDLEKNHALKYVSAQVSYLFHPGAWRRESLDYLALVDKLREKYDLSFRVPDIVKALRNRGNEGPVASGPEGAGAALNEALKNVLDSEDGLMFRDGVLRYQDRGHEIDRRVRAVNIHSQHLHVEVDGRTGEAEFVSHSIASDILEVQGLQPRWDDFAGYIEGVRYVTTTKQAIGATLNRLFSDAFRSFLQTSIVQDLGWKMGFHPSSPGETEQAQFEVVCNFFRLEGSVCIFDKVSGDQETSRLNLYIENVQRFGTDQISITTHLHSDDHIKLVSALVKSMPKT